MDALHPALDATTTPTCRSSCAARAPTSRTPRASATSTRWPGCSSASSATAAPSSPRRPPSRPSELAFMPLWSYAHPNAIELAERVANYAPGDLNRVFFTSGGGEAVETAWKLAKNYFKLTGKPMQAQGDQPGDRLPRHHRRARCRSPGCPALKAPFEPLVPSTFRVPNTNFYRAPVLRRRRPRRRSAAGPPTRSRSRSRTRAPTPSPRSSSSRCRTPAAASRRRPATSSGSARSATSTTCCWSATR